MKKLLFTTFFAFISLWAYFTGAADAPINFPPSPSDSNTAPYATDPMHVDTTATAKSEDNSTKVDLEQRLATVTKAINVLQSSDDTRIPAWVVELAKGVVILHHWSGSATVSGSTGWGIGMEKTPAGGFSNPVFYELADGKEGAQAGAVETDTVVFLMSTQAMKTLTEDKYAWSGHLRAVAGVHSANPIAFNKNIDAFIFQQANGLSVGATVAATQLVFDKSSNRIFYGLDLKPEEIINSTVQPADKVKSLADALKEPLPVSKS